MTKTEVFFKKFIKEVRDETIDIHNNLLNGKIKTENGSPIYELLKRFDKEDTEAINIIVKDAIDRAVFYSIFFFQESEDFAVVGKEEAENFRIENIIDENDDISKYLFGEKGYFAKYSKYK